MDEKEIQETLRKLNEPEDEVLAEAELENAVENLEQLATDSSDEQLAALKLDRDVPTLEPGDRLGEYVVEQEVGYGGMGIIYLATQETINRTVALKTVIPEQANSFTLERFRREREILGQLHESNIVSVFSAGTQGNIEYFAMPYIRGLSVKRLVPLLSAADAKQRLQDIVANKIESAKNADSRVEQEENGGRWSPSRVYLEDVVSQITELASGVQAVHDAGFIHRDITPNNVLVDTGGRLWLIDFGIAARIPDDVDSIPSPGVFEQSIDGQLGTPRYKAPELKKSLAGKQTDIFGLGVCLYCLLSATDFSNESYFQDDAPDKPLFHSSVPRGLAAVCETALKNDPADRYATPREFADDLNRWLRNEPVSSREYPVRERAALWVKRNPVFASVMLATALISGLLWYASWQSATARASEQEAKIHRLQSMFLAGDYEGALEFISQDQATLEISAVENPDLFLSFVRRLIWFGQNDEARSQIQKARELNRDPAFLSRLKLAEAELESSFDFDRAKTLAVEAKESGQLTELDVNLANVFSETNSITEQQHLEAIMQLDPWQLRAQQLLCLNYLFLGQKDKAALQISNAKMLYPGDCTLNIAGALLAGLNGDRDQARLILDRQKDEEPDRIDSLLTELAKILPDPSQIGHEDGNTAMAEADKFLVALRNVQTSFAKEGLILLPPAYSRVLAKLDEFLDELDDPTNEAEYQEMWQASEEEFANLRRLHPEGLFAYQHARAIIAQQTTGWRKKEAWIRADEILEQALDTGSIVPIRPLIVQYFALTRIELWRNWTQTEEARERMIEALNLFETDGTMPDYWLNCRILFEAAWDIGNLRQAALFAERWRSNLPDDANSYAYSALVANKLENYLNAHRWMSKAMEMAPDHESQEHHARHRSAAADALRKYIENIESND